MVYYGNSSIYEKRNVQKSFELQNMTFFHLALLSITHPYSHNNNFKRVYYGSKINFHCINLILTKLQLWQTTLYSLFKLDEMKN